MFQMGNQAWVVLDTSEFSKLDDPLNLYESMMAQIILTERDRIKSLESKLTMQVGANYQRHELKMGVEPNFMWYINKKGGLEIAPGGGLQVQTVFTEQGKALEYALLRYANVLRIYDLTVPLVVTSSSPDLPRLGDEGVVDGLMGDKRRIRRLLNPNLIIPRLRAFVENPEELVRELEKEIAEDIERTETKSSKRRHEVTCFARRLPKGYKASPSALALAQDEGIRLDENETCVRRHERGTQSEEAVGPHKAIRHN